MKDFFHIRLLIFQEEEEAGEVEYEDEVQPETSSTTEASKKFIKGGILRPFRSNDDLLATLKRRREQVATSKYAFLRFLSPNIM